MCWNRPLYSFIHRINLNHWRAFGQVTSPFSNLLKTFTEELVMLIEKTQPGLHSNIYDLLFNKSLIASDKSVLDIGCGTGAWLRRISVGRLVGIDYLQPDALEGLDLRRFDINVDDPKSLGTFELVTCIEVIEHIENIGRLLDLIQNSLAPNGVAMITTPNVESLRARVRHLVVGKMPSFDEKSDPTHLMPILQESLIKMLKVRNMVIAERFEYPSNKSETVQFRKVTSLIANLLGVFFSDKKYGDNSIFLIKHA
jgi:2-polyprenyl-3-methyl-5-hydroxy-6-metoxy-1,4-benzoquinol methylase